MQGLGYAAAIPFAAYHWTPEAKGVYRKLRQAIGAYIADQENGHRLWEVQGALMACAGVKCYGEILLLTSVLQVRNVIRCLTAFPKGYGWDFIKDAMFLVKDPFNKANLTNERVCALFLECGGQGWHTTVPSSWRPKEIAGQTFWLQ